MKKLGYQQAHKVHSAFAAYSIALKFLEDYNIDGKN